MEVSALRLGLSMVRHAAYRGAGTLAGLAPDPEVPDSPDGRFHKLNEPAIGRVVVFERSGMRRVDATLSAADGTWKIANLDPSLMCVVIGFDDQGIQNAAIQDWVKPYVPE